MAKIKQVFIFNKNRTYSVDAVNRVMQSITSVSHKPKILDSYSNEMVEDAFSDNDYFDKTVKITVEITE